MANKTGADAIRLYMINSPVVKADSLKFSNKGVDSIVKEVLLHWFNSYRYLISNITRWEIITGKKYVFDNKVKMTVMNNPEAKILDKWIIAAS